MRSLKQIGLILSIVALPLALVHADSIPEDQVDSSQIYVGSASSFASAAEVDAEKALQATPEYQEIKRKKIDSGTGKYWILVSQANDRVYRAISDVASESGYDLVAEKGYLGSLDPAVSSTDITKEVIEKISG